MKLHSITDIITNSSSITFIYPIDNAVEATKKFLWKIMNASGVSMSNGIEDYFEIHIEPSDDWYWNVFWKGLEMRKEFLISQNMDWESFYKLEIEEQSKIVDKFKIQARQDYLDGKLDFNFNDENDYEFWPRYLDVIITTKKGEIINLKNEVLEIYNSGEFTDE